MIDTNTTITSKSQTEEEEKKEESPAAEKSEFTEEEMERIQQEIDKKELDEREQIYKSVIDKAKFLIQLQTPASAKFDSQASVVEPDKNPIPNWKNQLKEKGSIKSVTNQKQESFTMCAKAVLQILQIDCSVSKI